MNILLIDDHKLFSQSLKLILELSKQVHQVDLSDDFSSLPNIAYQNYDIILVDINLTSLYDDGGLALAEHILQQHPNSKVVMLTGYRKQIYEHRAQRMGASGFIDKSIAPDDLVQKLLAICSGQKIFSDTPVIELLTNREIELLTLIRQGLSIDDVAQQLYLSKRTVSNHLANAFAKLEVTNRQEAIHKAEQLGYFIPD